MNDFTPNDIKRTRLGILDELIDEMVRAGQDKGLHPVDRVAHKQLTLDLESLRHREFDAEWRWRQARILRNSILNND